MENFWFTLFDLTGVIEMETLTHRYTYYLDGAIVRRAAKCAGFSPGKALVFIKKHAVDVQKEERTMAQPTESGKIVRRQRALKEIEGYMSKHGNFTMFLNGKSLRVFPATCDCKHNRITGVLFFKWAKRNARYKKFDRLIMHVVCYRCQVKSPIMVMDPIEYDPTADGFTKMNAFLKEKGLKHWQFKV